MGSIELEYIFAWINLDVSNIEFIAQCVTVLEKEMAMMSMGPILIVYIYIYI